MTNPYESSHEQQPIHPAKPYLESKSNLARLSWRIPLIGLLLSIVINTVAEPLALVGSVLFIGSVVIGLILSLVGIALSLTYSRVARHAVCGLILNSLLALSIFAMFHAISLARDAAIRAREKRAAEVRIENSTPLMPEHNQP